VVTRLRSWNIRRDAAPRKGPARSVRRRLGPSGLIGSIIVGTVLLVALAAPWLAPHDPADQDITDRLAPPVWEEGGGREHLLGTDQVGRDILSRLIYGARVSVAVGVSAVMLAGAVGVTLGVAAGYFRGWCDAAISRVIDTFMVVPGLLLTMAILGAVGPGIYTLVLVLGLTRWVTYARVVRGETLSLREREFVLAARAVGQSEGRIMARHILRNAAASVIVLATLNVAGTIIAESALSFLGLGVQPPVVTWGQMLSDGRAYLTSSWWLATFPGLAITITVLGVLLLGDWLRDALDPRLR